MKFKILSRTASAILAAGLVHHASAQNWTGGGTDTLWSDAANWDTGVPGTTTANGVTIGANAGGSESTVVTIAAGDVENCGTVGGNQSIYGPQWGSKLDISGTLNLGFLIFPCQWDSTPGNQSVINMYNGSAMNGLAGGNTLLLGDAWWYAAPYVTMNMYGNSQANFQYFAWGGHLNLYDNSTMTITDGTLVGTTAGFWGVAGPSDSTRLLNLAGGILVLPGGSDATVTNWVSRGIFQVYGKAYDTNEVLLNDVQTGITTNTTYVTNSDTTITTNTTYVTNSITIVTAPALGTLQNIYLQSPRSTMMVGTFQNPIALGNFSGISSVPLSALDAAQSGSNTVVYSSSAPGIVSVTTNGYVTALSPGTATVSATLGAFTSTNSVLITVTPLVNGLIHRYSFSESSGSTTADSVGGAAWAGTIGGGATLGGGQVALDGSSGFVQLPAGIVSNLDAVTIEAWADFENPQAYAALYYFGNQDDSFSPLGENYIGFQPFTGAVPPTANALFGAGDPGYDDEQDATLPLAPNGVTNYLTNVHLVVVYHPYAGYIAVYTNGVLAVINSNVSNPLAATLGADPLNYIGESLYGSDPFLNATIDEFRIYNGPLTAGQIAADDALGPNQVIGSNANVSLSVSAASGNLVIKWPTSSALVTLMSSPVLGAGAVWTQVSSVPNIDGNNNYSMTIPAAGATQFFRLQK